MPISFKTTQWPIDRLLEWRERGRIKIPTHQRGFVWDTKLQTGLIDTVTRGLPLPSLTLSKDSQNPDFYFVEDGQQRITTLLKYRNGETCIKGRFFMNESEQFRNAFLSYKIGVLIYEDATQEERVEIFDRLQNGMALSAGERFNALRYLSPTVQWTCDMILNEGAAYNRTIQAFWGEKLLNPSEERLKDGTKRFGVLKEAVSLCAGLLWGPEFYTDSYDKLRENLRQPLTSIQMSKAKNILLRLFKIYGDAIAKEMPNENIIVKDKKLKEDFWKPKNFSFYILYGLWTYPNTWPEQTEKWVNLLSAYRVHPKFNKEKVQFNGQNITGVDKWRVGYQSVMGQINYDAVGGGVLHEDSEED